jgi:pimeloyl-ACP methyl ester carboxylesterase
MRFLAQKLKQKQYCVIAPTLPTTFRSVRECAELLELIVNKQIPERSVVHFIGHSMGGLVIRDYLSRRAVEGLGRIVLIGAPNGGSPYANLLMKLPFFRRIYKSLPDLAVPGLDIPPPLNFPAPDIGVIIGIKPDFFRKYLLRGVHDGLVTAESVRRITANDEMTVSCIHERLHWRTDTAAAIASFLETGKF